MLECGLGGGREVALAGADADDQVGIAGNAICRRSAGRADRAHVQRVVVA